MKDDVCSRCQNYGGKWVRNYVVTSITMGEGADDGEKVPYPSQELIQQALEAYYINVKVNYQILVT